MSPEADMMMRAFTKYSLMKESRLDEVSNHDILLFRLTQDFLRKQSILYNEENSTVGTTSQSSNEIIRSIKVQNPLESEDETAETGDLKVQSSIKKRKPRRSKQEIS